MHHEKVTRPKVLLVEDDDGVRSALDLSLRRVGIDVRSQPAGREFDELKDDVDEFRPDLAILAVPAPTSRGFAMVSYFCHRDVQVICLADNLQGRIVALRAGAHDCLVRPFSIQELIVRARAVLAGSTKTPGAPLYIADVVLDEATRTVCRAGKILELTRTEFDLLAVLARHPAQVLSKVQLFGQVWGFGDYDPNLVEVHICSLRKKLEAHGSRLIHTRRNTGYVLSA